MITLGAPGPDVDFPPARPELRSTASPLGGFVAGGAAKVKGTGWWVRPLNIIEHIYYNVKREVFLEVGANCVNAPLDNNNRNVYSNGHGQLLLTEALSVTPNTENPEA